jgi:HSP20 family protein
MANIIRRNERESREVSPRGRASLYDPFRMMGELLGWDPFAEVERFGRTQPGAFTPAVEVRETHDGYLFKLDVPGVKDENIDISVTGNRLVISGTREEEKRDENERYLAYESSYGSFSRSFTLPDGTDAENVRAELKHGVLHVTVPKRPEVQPRRIPLAREAGREGSPTGKGQAKS